MPRINGATHTHAGVRLIRRILALLIATLALVSPASATTLLNIPITTAITTSVTPNFQLRGTSGSAYPNSMGIQCNFTYGSGGTTALAWVQTSLDGGTTWQDVAFCSFATTSVRQVLNVISTTAVIAPVIGSDGGIGGTPLTANTAVSGVFGNWWRVKYATTGTYAGGTTLRIDLITNGLTTP